MTCFHRRIALRSLALAGFASAALATAAHGEAFDPPPSGGTVRIESAALSPERIALGTGERLVFQNDSASMARVELELERGEGIACASAGEAPIRGRKFVVSTGGSLECDAPAGPIAYRVYRNGGGSRAELHGRIETVGSDLR